MKVLVACEESQRVALEFRKLGHEAYSCDLLECSGNHPEWHIKKDVTLLLNGNCIFNTVDGLEHEISGKWDMIIAFPPCTYLTVTGNRWFNYEKYGDKAIQRMLDRNDAIKFFMTIANADCDKIAIENPVGIMSTKWRKPDQIIQPFEYGDAYEKRTCLWLKGLEKLTPTNVVEIPDRIKFKSGKTMAKWYVEAGNLSKEQRALVRSKTFPGIAKAMAAQWGKKTHSFPSTASTRHSYKEVDKVCGDCSHFNACMQGNETVAPTCCMFDSLYMARKNPNWHHVSLATLANIDFDMLDEKRQSYLTIYRELQETVNNARKCKTIGTFDRCTGRLRSKALKLYCNNEISAEFYHFITLKLSMLNVEYGLYDSSMELATGLHESRRYNKIYCN